MPQLLIELFCEEIPARMQLGAARDFERLFGAKLTASGLTFDSIKAYVGPRRLALVVEGLPTEQSAVSEEVKGPRDGAPEQAMAGFLRKVGLTQEQLTLENGVWMARIEKPGRRTADALPDMLRDVILSFPWPKSMRSGTSSFRWVRPLKRILFLFDGQVIPFELEGLVSSNQTIGHRYLSSGRPETVTDFASYEQTLRDNFVILDHVERQAVIADKARAVCAAAGCELIEDPGLLEEVAGLNEWPVPILGDMDPQFLTLPPEVIRTSMRTHQKYFAVRDGAAKMAAHFVIVANTMAVDGGVEIKRGNAKVLSARLSDGVFFWNEDNKAGNFDGWLTRLEGTTFHVKLGTMKQRVDRIVALAGYIAPLVGADLETTMEAARLAKADLASKMVGEFPELQGVMGGYYAEAVGLKPDIANAIREHYKPQGPSDSLPESNVAAAVALADKIDTLVGFFAIDEKPTGSKDPYALRRSALGILRIMRANDLRVSAREFTEMCATALILNGPISNFSDVGRKFDAQYESGPTESWSEGLIKTFIDYDGYISKNTTYIGDIQAGVDMFTIDENLEAKIVYDSFGEFERRLSALSYVQMDSEFSVLEDDGSERNVHISESHKRIKNELPGAFSFCNEILDFFNDRLKVQLREEGRRLDVIEATLGGDDIVQTIAKIEAIEAVLATPEGDDLLALHKRCANILAAAKAVSDLPFPSHYAGMDQLEKALLDAVESAAPVVQTLTQQENYIEALQTLAALRQTVDAFLDGVLVNADEPVVRAGRLALLARVCDLSKPIADLSKIA